MGKSQLETDRSGSKMTVFQYGSFYLESEHVMDVSVFPYSRFLFSNHGKVANAYGVSKGHHHEVRRKNPLSIAYGLPNCIEVCAKIRRKRGTCTEKK